MECKVYFNNDAAHYFCGVQINARNSPAGRWSGIHATLEMFNTDDLSISLIGDIKDNATNSVIPGAFVEVKFDILKQSVAVRTKLGTNMPVYSCICRSTGNWPRATDIGWANFEAKGILHLSK